MGCGVWGRKYMAKGDGRQAKLCRHVIRDEHPRSARAERDKTAELIHNISVCGLQFLMY
jgi:hypothetical protein